MASDDLGFVVALDAPPLVPGRHGADRVEHEDRVVGHRVNGTARPQRAGTVVGRSRRDQLDGRRRRQFDEMEQVVDGEHPDRHPRWRADRQSSAAVDQKLSRSAESTRGGRSDSTSTSVSSAVRSALASGQADPIERDARLGGSVIDERAVRTGDRVRALGEDVPPTA